MLLNDKGPSCPCCTFLPDDLFLPKSQAETDGADGEFGTGAARTISSELAVKHEEGQPSLSDDGPLSPQSAWYALNSQGAEGNSCASLLVDTHGHTHLERESQELYRIENDPSLVCSVDSATDREDDLRETKTILCLTCAVQESDWEDCLEYASRSKYRMAALGVHPWYLHGFSMTDNSWLDRLERHLQQHAGIMVGEIGLCKMAKLVRFPASEGLTKQQALELQRHVFVQQLKLAAQYC